MVTVVAIRAAMPRRWTFSFDDGALALLTVDDHVRSVEWKTSPEAARDHENDGFED